MDFTEQIKNFSKQIETRVDGIQTEEATKMSLIVPFFQLLGYDVFDPTEFCPEYTADVGIKKGEKVDYAIMKDGNPIVLIECKSCSEQLDKHSSQLFRYFGTSSAKFGILTNGIIYRFYTDLDESNKMDLVPFLEIDMLNFKDTQIAELKKFCKSDFDSDRIFSTASELKYSGLIKTLLLTEMDAPTDDFTRFILTGVYEGQKNQKIIDKFKPIIKRAFSSLVSETVNQKISSALNQEDKDNTEDEIEEEISKVITTDEEMQAFYIVRGILVGTADLNDIAHRDTESYFGILYQDNNRKPICRLKLDGKKKSIFIPDAKKNFTKYDISDIQEIYEYKDLLIRSTENYLTK